MNQNVWHSKEPPWRFVVVNSLEKKEKKKIVFGFKERFKAQGVTKNTRIFFFLSRHNDEFSLFMLKKNVSRYENFNFGIEVFLPSKIRA